jgi:hypothetical protein
MSYDPRAVKIPKEIKTFGATILNKEQRRSYFKSYTQITEIAMRTRSTRNKGDK